MLISFSAGAILGILYAPHKGSKTRRKLANIGNDLKRGWNSVADTIVEKIDDFKSSVDNAADNASDRVEHTQFNVNDRAGFL